MIHAHARLCAWVSVAGAVSLGICSCTSSQAQTEACFARADAAMVAEAVTRCKSHKWDECPVKDEIKAKYQAERRACP